MFCKIVVIIFSVVALSTSDFRVFLKRRISYLIVGCWALSRYSGYV